MHWNTLSTQQKQSLLVREEDKEINSLDDGVRRFHNQNQQQPLSKWPACRALIATASERLTEAIQIEGEKIASGRGMKGGLHWGHVFLYMEPQVLAVATICAMMDRLAADKATQQSMIYAVGSAVEMETHFTILKREAPRLKQVMERKIKQWTRSSIRRAMTRIEGDCAERWEYKRRIGVGAKLVDLAMQECGMFEYAVIRERNNRSPKYIRLTPEATSMVASINEHLEVLNPIWKPMLVPPNDWEQGEAGGYLILNRYHSLVKTRSDYPDMPDDHGPMVYASINALQATGWQINPIVLDTMLALWKQGGGKCGLPGADNDPIPERPDVEDDSEWRAAAEAVYRKNARAVGKRLALLQTLSIAQEYRRDVFYFPYQCDFRGRIYPIPQFLQPQGNDVARGLLQFATPEPLGETGLRWLCIQYANCWGVDKVSFDDRVAWAWDKLDCFYGHHHHPLDIMNLWAEADDPWQALATLWEIGAAMEWRREHGDLRDYPCPLPINVDGSNSGLQHFSAMLRDEHGAALVNLLPSQTPNDIYADVAKSVDRMVRADLADTDDSKCRLSPAEHAKGWLSQGINRTLCKRGTMTFCYGVTQQGLKNALIADGFLDWSKHQFASVQYIGKKIWAGICENITGATEAMDWLRQCASCGNKADKLLTWITPSGFHVVHPYNEPKNTVIKCLSGRVQFSLYDPEKKIRKHKQRNSLPPNFVHSLDASHLMMTVAAGKACGIEHWMMIHDSFGTHAGRVDLLRDILREQFMNLYEVDVLESFRHQVVDQTGVDPGPPPARGLLDLSKVLDSEYIFA